MQLHIYFVMSGLFFLKKKRIQNLIQNMHWKNRKEKGRLLPCSWATQVAAHFLPLSVFGRRLALLIVLSCGSPPSHPLRWPSKPVQDALPSPSPLGPPLLFLLRSPSVKAGPAEPSPFSSERPILGWSSQTFPLLFRKANSMTV